MDQKAVLEFIHEADDVTEWMDTQMVVAASEVGVGLCPYLSVSVSISFPVYLYLSVSLFLYFCLTFNLSVSLSLSLSLTLSVLPPNSRGFPRNYLLLRAITTDRLPFRQLKAHFAKQYVPVTKDYLISHNFAYVRVVLSNFG